MPLTINNLGINHDFTKYLFWLTFLLLNIYKVCFSLKENCQAALLAVVSADGLNVAYLVR